MEQNFDIEQWILRGCIILVSLSLGITLMVIERKKSIKSLAAIQIILSIVAPILMGCYIYNRKNNGAIICSDINQIADELQTIQYGNIAILLFIGLYILLIISSTLTIQKILALNLSKRKNTKK